MYDPAMPSAEQHDPPQPPSSSATSSDCRIMPAEVIGLVLALIVLVLFRLHAFALPLETDECNYAYIGARLLEGQRLYVDVWDHQPFGVFVLFAGVIAVFGDAPEVFRWMALLFSAASLLFIAAIVRRPAGRWWGVAAAMLFAVVSSDPGTAGEGCNREIYMNTLILAAWWLVVAARGRAGWRAAGAGVVLGLASTIKTVVAVHWLFLLLFVVLDAHSSRGESHARPKLRACHPTELRRRLPAGLRSAGLFALGPALIWLAAGAYFAATGHWREFVDAVFLFNVGYAGGDGSLIERFAVFFAPKRHPFIFRSAMPLWIGGATATAWLLWRTIARRDRAAGAVGALALAGYVAACLPAQFWPHYYYLLIPALVMACAVAAAEKGIRFLPPAFAVVAAALLFTQYREYLSQPPFGITVTRYNSRDFWGRGMGEKIRSVTAPDDTIFVYGSDTGVYYYAQRRCASRYTMITGLSDGYPGVDERRRVLVGELRERRPRIVLLLGGQEVFPELHSLFQERYVQIGMDLHDARRSPIAAVLCDAENPVDVVDPAWWDWDRRVIGGWIPDAKGRPKGGMANGE